jgi:hypothetical protein
MRGELQNTFTNTIRPASISRLRESTVFSEFMKYFQNDCGVFVATHDKVNAFIKHSETIRKELLDRELLSSFIVRIRFHSKLRDYKISTLDEYLAGLYDGYSKRIQEIRDDLAKDLGRTITIPIEKQEFETLTKIEKEVILEAEQKIQLAHIQFVGIISGLINLMFFAFESSCKVSCSFGCWNFAILFAMNRVIQHDTIWKALRRLGKIGEQTSTRCFACLMDKSCNFEIDFEVLANIYCYAIKMRMLTDYEDFFYENPEIWYQVEEYFKKLRRIIDCQKVIETKCLEVMSL